MKQIIVNQEQLETRIALVENGTIEEYYIQREGSRNIVGSIYKGRISNLESSLQAAFVDVGLDKNAFLHYWDMIPATEEMLEESEDDDEEEEVAVPEESAPTPEPAAVEPAESEAPAESAEDAPAEESATAGAPVEAPPEVAAESAEATATEDAPAEVPPQVAESAEATTPAAEEPTEPAEAPADDSDDQDPPAEASPIYDMAEEGGGGGEGGGGNRRGGRRRGGRRRGGRKRGNDGEQSDNNNNRNDSNSGGGSGNNNNRNRNRNRNRNNNNQNQNQDQQQQDGEGGGGRRRGGRRRGGRNRNKGQKQDQQQNQQPAPTPEPEPEPTTELGLIALLLQKIRSIFGAPEPPAPEPEPEPEPAPEPQPEQRQEGEGGGRKRKRNRKKNKGQGGGESGDNQQQDKQQNKPKEEKKKDNKRRGRRRDQEDFDLSEIPKKFHVNTEVVVQVTKGAIGTKGPRVTTNLSIPGRYVVLLPNSGHRGVSRRIQNRRERDRLRKLVRQLELPKGLGLICRTAATDLDVQEVQTDVDMLVAKWQDAQMAIHDKPSPCCVYQEPDVLERTIRDFLSSDIDEIIVDSREAHKLVQTYVERLNAKDRTKVTLYQKARPIFQYYKIKKQIEQIFSRKVTLKSGAELCIDETEALIAIDINSGKSRGGKDHPETILRTNLEAAEAVARQLRLRNIGGLVVVDFIDMRSRKDQEAVYNCMRKGVERDRAKTRMLRISRLGLMEMTRQREYESLRDAVFEDCGYCHGKGLVKSALSISVEIQRRLQEVLRRRQGKDSIIRVTVHPAVAARIRKEDKALIEEMEEKYKGQLAFRSDARIHRESYKIIDSETGEEL